MDPSLYQNILYPNIQIDPLVLVFNLSVGLVLAMMVKYHYFRFGRALFGRDELSNMIPLLTLTTILVISVIKASIALSLGLVGALSIVRFRTPIKEPEQLAYLFFSIAIGIGIGASVVLPTFISTIFILIVVTVIKLYKTESKATGLTLNIQDKSGKNLVNNQEELIEIIKKFGTNVSIRRLSGSEKNSDLLFHLDLDQDDKVIALTKELQKRFPSFEFTFLHRDPNFIL